MKLKLLSSLFVLLLGAGLTYGGYFYLDKKIAQLKAQEFHSMVRLHSESVTRKAKALHERVERDVKFLREADESQREEYFAQEADFFEIALAEPTGQKNVKRFEASLQGQMPGFRIWPQPLEEGELEKELMVVTQERGRKEWIGYDLFSMADLAGEPIQKLKENQPLSLYTHFKSQSRMIKEAPLWLYPLWNKKRNRLEGVILVRLSIRKMAESVTEDQELKDSFLDFRLSDAKGNDLRSIELLNPRPDYAEQVSLSILGLHFSLDYQADLNFYSQEDLMTPLIALGAGAGVSLVLLIFVFVLASSVLEERRLKIKRERLNRFYENCVAAAQRGPVVEEMIKAVLVNVSDYTGWPIAHVFLPDSDGKEARADIWHFSSYENYGYFKAQYQSKNFMTGMSLTDRVLHHDQSVWVENIALDGSFTKSRMQKNQKGVITAIGVPVRVRGEVIAVMEFFSEVELAFNEELKAEVDRVAYHLGEYIERTWSNQSIDKVRELQRLVIDFLPDPVFLLGEEGRIRLMNQAAQDTFGYRESDIKGMDFPLMLAGPYDLEFQRAFERFAQTRKLMSLGEGKQLTGKKKGGSQFGLTLRMEHYKIQGEGMILVHGRTQSQLSETKPLADSALVQPMRAAQPQAHGNLDFQVHHPLAGQDATLLYTAERIQKALEDLLKEKLSHKAEEEIKAISYSTAELHEALECLMDLSRFEVGTHSLQSAPFDLVDLLEEFLETVAPRVYTEGLELLCDLGQNLPTKLIGDREKLLLCLKLMVNNALQYTKEGEVFLEVQSQMSDLSKAKLVFTVHDTGKGISPQALQAIRVELFEKGEVKEHKDSIGLTLTYAKKFAQLHEGSVSVQSEGLGKGASLSMTLLLPRQKEEEKPLGLAKNLDGQKYLLFAENKSLRFLLRNRLSYAGAQVAECRSAEEFQKAFEAAREKGQYFDRLILVQGVKPKEFDASVSYLEHAEGVGPLLCFADSERLQRRNLEALRLDRPIRPHEPNQRLLRELEK